MTIQTLLMAAERYDKLGEHDKKQALLDRVDLRLSRSPDRYPHLKYKDLVRDGFKLVRPEPKPVEKPKDVKKPKR